MPVEGLRRPAHLVFLVLRASSTYPIKQLFQGRIVTATPNLGSSQPRALVFNTFGVKINQKISPLHFERPMNGC